MKPKSSQLVACGLSVVALLCWLVIFLAGTDVWHDVGSPAVWTLQGPPYVDFRACLYAFYLLLVVLLACVAVTSLGVAGGTRADRKGA
jgi:hypothetical protein